MFNAHGKMPPAVGERVTLRFAAEDLLVITD
jgi:putative spermidine/putrescine transport system ATP-binding protein